MMNSASCLLGALGLLAVQAQAGRQLTPAQKVTAALAVYPKSVVLAGPYHYAKVIVSALNGKASRDVTEEVRWTTVDDTVAVVDGDGFVRPRKNGRTQLLAEWKAARAVISVNVTGMTPKPPSFTNEVLPTLTRAGCNMGACHGSAQGKGGLRLSLQGFDAEADYHSLIRSGKYRRINPADPESSLLLRKPLLKVAHKGGKRLRADSGDYGILRDWIAYGMPPPDPKDSRVTRLEVIPPLRTLAPGQKQSVIVRATFSSGIARDVTSHALFSAEDESVARVSPDGIATATGNGEAAVLVRYQDQVAAARIISPFGTPRQPMGQMGPIDRLINVKLAQLGLPASSPCSDSDFLRRAYLDLIGGLPTPDEARRFLSARSSDRRARLVDELMERPEFVDFWAYRWADLLRVNRAALRDKGAVALYNWIRNGVAENKPWDRFAREIILAEGGTFDHGPANFYRANGRPEELAETTAQAFLGVRIQCAKCHNHPYEKWTQNQYYELAAFFAQANRKPRGDEAVILAARGGDVKHPRTGKSVIPAALGSSPIPADYSGDRREKLADWLTSPRNPFFARVLVNRVWRHFMGRGLVEPVDDIRQTNPPSNEPLLAWLADEFAKTGFDVRRLMRSIMLTDAYQRSSEPVKGNERDSKYYSRYPFKRMRAEQLLDSLAAATGVPEKFDGFPAGFRASQLPIATVSSYFLDLFGRPARNITCECERTDDPNLGQLLHLMNNSGINARIASNEGRVSKLIEMKRSNPQIVEELYLAAFSRYPTPAELIQRIAALDKAKDRKQAAEDLLWALVNSKEFIFNH